MDCFIFGFTVFLGLLHGGVIIPMALYLGQIVSRDLSKRHTKLGTIVNIAPLVIIVVWLAMSYLAADSLLDIIADSSGVRLNAGRLWVVCSFLGLVMFAAIYIAMNRMKLTKKK